VAKETLLTPVQDAMVKCHGSQCGFCTPGFVMAMTALWKKSFVNKDAARSLSAKPRTDDRKIFVAVQLSAHH